MDTSVFYNYNEICSKMNTLARRLGFIIGARGCGKTFGFKKKAVENFLERGEQFVYVRRTKDEIEDKKSKEAFWPIAIKEAYPDHEFSYDGTTYLIDGQIAGFGIVLSTALKSKSTEYDRVTMGVLDEFICIGGPSSRYLPNEVDCLLELLVTIFRFRKDWKFFFISNAVTWNNPYFIKFNIPVPDGRFYLAKSYVLDMPPSVAYEKFMSETPIGQMLADLDADYYDYAFKNHIYTDRNDFIKEKSKYALYNFTLIFKDQSLGVWTDYERDEMFITEEFNAEYPYRVTFKATDHKEDCRLLTSRHPMLKQLRAHFENGGLFFGTAKVKNIMYEWYKKFT